MMVTCPWKKHACNLDTHRKLCLFDGRRGHQVKPFEGVRYSLVWFAQQRYKTAKPESLRTLERLGAPNPSDALLAHFNDLLARPRGYEGGLKQKSIKRAFSADATELPIYLGGPGSGGISPLHSHRSRDHRSTSHIA